MNMSVAEVKAGKQYLHPVLANPMKWSTIRYKLMRRKVEEHREKRKIGQDLRQESSWL